MSHRSRRRRLLTQREAWRMVRFLTVGGGVALIYGGLFLGLRAAGVPIWIANGIAFGSGVIFQYLMHTTWTFRSSVWDSAQQARFLGVIGFGVLFSYGATVWLSPAMGWGDEVAAALVIFLLPLFNFALYRLWVFRG